MSLRLLGRNWPERFNDTKLNEVQKVLRSVEVGGPRWLCRFLECCAREG